MAKQSYSQAKAIRGIATQLRPGTFLGPTDSSLDIARLHAATFIIGHFDAAKKPAVYDAAIAYVTKHLKTGK